MTRKKFGTGAARRIALLFLCSFLLGMPLGSLAQAPATDAKEAPKYVISDAQAAEFAGRYQNPDEPETVASIYNVGAKLYLNGVRSPAVELIPDGKDKFTVFGAPVSFERDASGKVTALLL